MVSLPSAPHGFAGPEALGKIPVATASKLEICGRAYFNNFEQDTKVEIAVEEADESSASESSGSKTPGGDSKPDYSKKSKVRAGVLKLDEGLEGRDLYKFMDVQPDVDPKDLKAAFRKQSLVYHPDKTTKEVGEEEANKQYVALQTAYDILSDPVKRRKYDSTLPFDDSLTKESECSVVTELRQAGEPAEADAEFYDLFFPVFQRNSKWSIKQPVPELPKPEEQDVKVVQEFYKFWFNFDSWRDFDVKIVEEEGEDALDNPDKADSREERRWMENKNVRIRQKYRNTESARLMKLVELAEKYDSRIIRFNEEKWERKNAGKVQKQKAAEEKVRLEQEAVEAAARAEVEAAAKKEAEKKQKDQAKQIIKDSRRQIRNLSKVALAVNQDQMQDLLLKLDVDALVKFKEELDNIATSKDNVTKFIFAAMEQHGMTVVKMDEAQVAKERAAEEAAEEERQAEREAAEAREQAKKDKKSGKKGGKKNKKGGNAEDELAPHEADEARLAREADRARAAAQKKREAEQKSEAAAAKAEREAKQQKADAEKEKKSKDAEKKKQEELRAKQAAEAAAKNEKEAARRAADELNDRADRFCKVRQEQMDHMNEIEDLKEFFTRNLTSEIRNALVMCKKAISDEEGALDMAAVIIAKFASEQCAFVEMGKQVHEAIKDKIAPVKNQMKKQRNKIRDVLKSYLDAEAAGSVPQDIQKIIKAFPAFPQESWQEEGFVVVSAGGGEDGSKKKKKKKGANKGGNEEDDFEAMLAEFGAPEKKKTKKGKK